MTPIAYVVEYQSTRRGLWCEYFKWFSTKQEATQWIADHPIHNPQMRYRVKAKHGLEGK